MQPVVKEFQPGRWFEPRAEIRCRMAGRAGRKSAFCVGRRGGDTAGKRSTPVYRRGRSGGKRCRRTPNRQEAEEGRKTLFGAVPGGKCAGSAVLRAKTGRIAKETKTYESTKRTCRQEGNEEQTIPPRSFRRGDFEKAKRMPLLRKAEECGERKEAQSHRVERT